MNRRTQIMHTGGQDEEDHDEIARQISSDIVKTSVANLNKKKAENQPGVLNKLPEYLEHSVTSLKDLTKTNRSAARLQTRSGRFNQGYVAPGKPPADTGSTSNPSQDVRTNSCENSPPPSAPPPIIQRPMEVYAAKSIEEEANAKSSMISLAAQMYDMRMSRKNMASRPSAQVRLAVTVAHEPLDSETTHDDSDAELEFGHDVSLSSPQKSKDLHKRLQVSMSTPEPYSSKTSPTTLTLKADSDDVSKKTSTDSTGIVHAASLMSTVKKWKKKSADKGRILARFEKTAIDNGKAELPHGIYMDLVVDTLPILEKMVSMYTGELGEKSELTIAAAKRYKTLKEIVDSSLLQRAKHNVMSGTGRWLEAKSLINKKLKQFTSVERLDSGATPEPADKKSAEDSPKSDAVLATSTLSESPRDVKKKSGLLPLKGAPQRKSPPATTIKKHGATIDTHDKVFGPHYAQSMRKDSNESVRTAASLKQASKPGTPTRLGSRTPEAQRSRSNSSGVSPHHTPSTVPTSPLRLGAPTLHGALSPDVQKPRGNHNTLPHPPSTPPVAVLESGRRVRRQTLDSKTPSPMRNTFIASPEIKESKEDPVEAKVKELVKESPYGSKSTTAGAGRSRSKTVTSISPQRK